MDVFFLRSQKMCNDAYTCAFVQFTAPWLYGMLLCLPIEQKALHVRVIQVYWRTDDWMNEWSSQNQTCRQKWSEEKPMWVCTNRCWNHRTERIKSSYWKVTSSSCCLLTILSLNAIFHTWCVVTSISLFNTEGAGSIPCIRCIRQRGKAVFKLVAHS